MNVITGLFVLIAFIGTLIWAMTELARQSQKDWDTVRYLETEAEKVNTLEELIQFHKEFVDKASKIFNKYCQARLARVDGYLRGLHKKLKE